MFQRLENMKTTLFNEMNQMKQRAGVSREKDFNIKEKMSYGKLKQLYREIDMVQTIYPESPNTMGFKEVKKPQKGDIVRPCNARDNQFDEIIEKVSWWNNKITYESGRWVSDTQLYQLQLHGTLEIIKATEKQNQA